ncbi:hypothetical protein L9F63_001609, partial [Diploptera punctata]
AGELRYKKKTGVAEMGGELFEIKMAALLFLRAINSNSDFYIASNMDLQVPSMIGIHNAKIYTPQLLAYKGKFSLIRYWKSYLNIKNVWSYSKDLQVCGRFEDALFGVFTSAELVGSDNSNVGNSDIHKHLNAGGKVVEFSKKYQPKVIEMFENLSRWKELLKKRVNNEEMSDTTELLRAVQTLMNTKAKDLPAREELVKLLTELESLGDLTDYSEFLSKVFYYTEQARESKLDDFIKDKLKILYGNDDIFDKLIQEAQKWWRESNIYLTVKAEFFQSIIQKCATSITKGMPTLKLKFTEHECNNIKTFLIDNRKIILRSNCTNLSCMKVLQSLKGCLYVDVCTLQTHLSEVLMVWKFGIYKVIVIEGEIIDENILKKLISALENKSVIVVSKDEDVQMYQQLNFASFFDSFRLSQLNEASQRELLEQEVIFQGYPAKLNLLVDKDFLENVVTAEIVMKLQNSMEIGQKLDDLDPCYIPRTFLRKEFVTNDIFISGNTLAISGITKNQLKCLISEMTENKVLLEYEVNVLEFSKDKLETKCNNYIIGGETEFKKFCEKYRGHWIHKTDEGFHWKKTEKSLSILSISKFFEQKYANYSVEEILSLSDDLILLIAEAGMGKSTELCNIAHLLKENDRSIWVTKVDLNHCKDLLKQDQISAMEFIEKVSKLRTEFEKQLFEYYFKSNENIVVLLDGFDEVSPSLSHCVFRLIKEIIDKQTLRYYNFPILPFNLETFSSDDQRNFLLRNWKQNVLHTEEYDLNEFISSLLTLVDSSLSDRMKEVTGIPLQTRMLAEVYQEEAEIFCKSGKIELPQSLNVLELFDMFFEKKWEVYCKKINVGVEAVMLEQLIDNQKIEFQQSLMITALVSNLDQEDIESLIISYDIFEKNKTIAETFDKGLDNTGIISDFIDNKAIFIHRTYEEYFVALWFSKNFNIGECSIQKLYIRQDFQGIRNFLDRILSREFKLHDAVLNEDITQINTLIYVEKMNVDERDAGGRTALHLAVMSYFGRKPNESIINTLLECGANLDFKDMVLHWRPLRLAEEIQAWSVVERLLERNADNRDLVIIRKNIKKATFGMHCCWPGVKVMSVTNLAISEGFVNLVEFILESGVSVQHYIKDRHVDKTSMLHVGAEHGQLRLVQFLVEKGCSINCENWFCNRTPLMRASENGHLQIVKFLVEHRAATSSRNKDGDNALSLASREGKCEVVKYLTIDKGENIETLDWYKSSPLMKAAEFAHFEVVKFLIDQGSEVNARNKDGYTALSLAARTGEPNVVELLLQNGADVNTSGGWYNRTPLMLSAEYGHHKVANLLIDHGTAINARDEGGYTALSIAARKGRVKIVQLLLEKDVNIELSDFEYNRTPLMWAAEWGRLIVVELLLHEGANKKARDKDGNTAFSIAVQKERIQVTELLASTDIINVCDKWYKRTPLMFAVECGQLQIIECLIKWGANLNDRNKDGFTALSLAAKKEDLRVSELLLISKADTEIPDLLYDRTPLMWAAEWGHVSVVDLLTKHGACVNARNKDGHSAMSIAVSKQNDVIVNMLLERGANIHLTGLV